MDLELLRKKLLAAARGNPPTDRVPYAFEKRVMEHLKHSPAVDCVALWARALWRAVAPCAAVAVFMIVWSTNSANNTPDSAQVQDLSNHFEQVMLADVVENFEETP